jgi:hypothetical protein
MTRTLTLVRSGRPLDDVDQPRGETSIVWRRDAKEACDICLASIAPAGPLGGNERRAIMDAIVEILSVRSDRPIPIRPRPSVRLHLLIEGLGLSGTHIAERHAPDHRYSVARRFLRRRCGGVERCSCTRPGPGGGPAQRCLHRACAAGPSARVGMGTGCRSPHPSVAADQPWPKGRA